MTEKEIMDQYERETKQREARIARVFPKRLKNTIRSLKTLAYYEKYLEKHLTLPVLVRNTEGFGEDPFPFLLDDKYDFEELKKSKPWLKQNVYRMRKIEEYYTEEYGLLMAVTRVTDRKRYVMMLAEVEVIDQDLAAYQLVDDYTHWFNDYEIS